MTLTEKSGHLAWCALIALAMARKDGTVHSVAQENFFITRWLSTALKQHRFPREVAPDIEWLAINMALAQSWPASSTICGNPAPAYLLNKTISIASSV